METESKLYRYLKTCTGYELRRMRVLLMSPFFNQRPEIVHAWDCMRPYFPVSDLPLPTAEAVFEAAFPDLAFDTAKYRHLQSDLCKLVETFWQMQQLQQHTELQSQLLLQAQTDRGLDADFGATMVQAQTQLLAQPLRGNDYLRQRFDLALRQHDHAVRLHNRDTQVGLQAAMEALDEEYFAHKLRLAAAAINRAMVLGESTDIALLPEVTACIDASPAIVYAGSLVEVYRLVLRTLQEQADHDAFGALLAWLAEHAGQLSATNLAELYAFALNYCVRMVNLAEPEFDEELYRLYVLLVDRGYLREQGHLPVQHFKNLVTLGLRLGQSKAIAALIETLASQLPPEIGPNAVCYAQAALALHLGDHGRALRLLQQVEFTDVYYHLDAKSLLLKAWYAQGEVEPLLSLLESFKIYLRRSRKISDYQRLTYRNQLKVLQMLVRHRLGSRKPLAEIKAALADLRPIADLQWLERMVEELCN